MSTRILLLTALALVVGVLTVTSLPRPSFAQNTLDTSTTTSATSTPSTTTATSTATSTGATISLSPASGPTGTFVTTNGTGFSAGEDVRITFGTYTTYLAANQSGSFSVSLLAPPLSTTSASTSNPDTSGAVVTAMGSTSNMLATAAFTNTSNSVSTSTASSSMISAVQAVPTGTEAAISWMSSTPGTSQVVYGTTTNYGTYSALDTTLNTNHAMTLSALQPNTLYHFIVMSMDSNYNATSSVDHTFTTLDTATTTATTTGNTASTTPQSSEIAALWAAIGHLQMWINSLQEQLRALHPGSGSGNQNNGGTGNATSTPASIDQNGQTIRVGNSIDFGGHNFGSEEYVLIKLNGTQVAQGFTNLGGGFSTGSLSTPATPGTYTYTFTGQASGKSATATITVQ